MSNDSPVQDERPKNPPPRYTTSAWLVYTGSSFLGVLAVTMLIYVLASSRSDAVEVALILAGSALAVSAVVLPRVTGDFKFSAKEGLAGSLSPMEAPPGKYLEIGDATTPTTSVTAEIATAWNAQGSLTIRDLVKAAQEQGFVYAATSGAHSAALTKGQPDGDIVTVVFSLADLDRPANPQFLSRLRTAGLVLP